MCGASSKRGVCRASSAWGSALECGLHSRIPPAALSSQLGSTCNGATPREHGSPVPGLGGSEAFINPGRTW